MADSQTMIGMQPRIKEIDEVTDEGNPAGSPVRVRDALSSSSHADTTHRKVERIEPMAESEDTSFAPIGESSKYINVPSNLAGTKSGMINQGEVLDNA